MQAHASQAPPTVAVLCDVTNSPLQAASQKPASTAYPSKEAATANAAESLVLYAMQKVAAKVTRCVSLLPTC